MERKIKIHNVIIKKFEEILFNGVGRNARMLFVIKLAFYRCGNKKFDHKEKSNLKNSHILKYRSHEKSKHLLYSVRFRMMCKKIIRFNHKNRWNLFIDIFRYQIDSFNCYE